MEALQLVEKEKGIPRHILIDAIESALISAYKRDQKDVGNIRVELNSDSGDVHVYTYREVVEELEDERLQILLQDARRVDPHYELGDVVEEEIVPREFGRIAAQTAKQVVVQRIREAERILIYEEFVNREGDIVTGIVQRLDQRNVLLDLGKAESILPPPEQVASERYEQGLRLKVYIVEVRKTTKGPQIFVSRTHPGLLKRLFELEVPEIHDGVVEIKSVSREPGARSKVAVWSRDENVDPVGSCVGAKGARVQSIVRELRAEKIDIVQWDPDAQVFIANALSPARVTETRLSPDRKVATVIVPDNQLSLAIGKEGQNARLAAKLTGWKIDIKNETQAAEMDRLAREELDARRAEDSDEVLAGPHDMDETEARDQFVESGPEGEVISEEAPNEPSEDVAAEGEPVVHFEDEEEAPRKKGGKKKAAKPRRERFDYFEDLDLDD